MQEPVLGQEAEMNKRYEYNKRWRLSHPESVKKSNKKSYLACPEYWKEWRRKHPKQISAASRKWEKKHPEKLKEYREKEARVEYIKKWELAHKKEMKLIRTEWAKNHPERMRDFYAKNKARRRELGFIPLNKPFGGSEAHHVDREMVIHIPAEMHQGNRHSVLRNQGMEKINRLAYEFLSGGENG